MKTFTQSELQEIIRLHGMWLRSEPGGSRANLCCAILSRAYLSDANLSGAYLSGAYLKGTILENKPIMTFQCGQHTAFLIGDKLRIGCHNHSLKEWTKNYKKIGKRHAYSAKEIRQYGLVIKCCVALNAKTRKPKKASKRAK